MLTHQRELFDLPGGAVYFNCAYTSPLLRSAAAAGRRALEKKMRPWEITADDFFDTLEASRALFAELIRTEADNVAVIPAVSYGISLAANNIPIARGQQVVVLGDQFPSNIYIWQQLAAAKGASITTVARPEDGNWTPAVVKAITPETAVAALPTCHWTDGTVIDLSAVGTACRKNGCALVVDGTQSLGAVPFDLEAVRPDFLVTTAHKWLLGPYSYGFCYVDPKWHHGRPLEENWLNRAGAQDFSRLVDYQKAYQPGARRYDVGEASNFILAPIAQAALKQILNWGVERIAASLETMTAEIAQQAKRLGFRIPDLATRSPHMIGLIHPDGLPPGLPASLAAEQIFVSIRGAAVRIAPHLYNTSEDIARLIDALKRLV